VRKSTLLLLGLLALGTLLWVRGASADLDDAEWRALYAAWKTYFFGSDTSGRLEVVRKMAEADDSRALAPLAHTVKICNAALSKLSKKEPEIRKAIDKIPYTQQGDRRTYDSKDLAKLKELQAGLRELQAAITENLNIKRMALRGFTGKSSTKALDWLFKKGLRNPDWEIRVGVIESLTEIDDARSVSSIVSALSDRDAHVRVAALTALNVKDARDHKTDILAMLKDKTWEVQAAALEVIGDFEYRCVETLDALVAGIVAAEGRLAEDYEAVLETITGISYYGDGKLWKRWWETNREKFAGAKPEPKKGEDDEGGGSSPAPPVFPKRPKPDKPHVTSSFYGIKTKSHNIIYILDVSGSMAGPAARKRRGKGGKGPVVTGPGHKKKKPGRVPMEDGPKGDTKLHVAKYELKKSINMLPMKAWFTVIFYSNEFECWDTSMVRATPQNKRKAFDFIDKQEPSGKTNIFDAMEKAFKIAGPGKPKGGKSDERYAQAFGGADTIFLLSDGSPNEGRIPNPNDILTEVGKLNKLRKITIHTVGVGAHNVSFMKALAEQNGGKYVKAD
jgi:hypothetical protein